MKKVSILFAFGALISCSDANVHVKEEMDDVVEQKRAEVVLQSLPDRENVGKVIFEERKKKGMCGMKISRNITKCHKMLQKCHIP